EGRRDDQHVFLLEHHPRLTSLGRPDALGSCFLANAETLARILVGPDMAPFVEAAELRIPGADQRRELGALGDLRAPAVDRGRNAARLERIDADPVEVAELARLELWRERRRQI